MCGSRKYPYPPQGRSLEIPSWGGGSDSEVSEAKLFKGKYEAKQEIPVGRGRRVQTKKPVFNDRSCSVPENKND